MEQVTMGILPILCLQFLPLTKLTQPKD